MTNRARKLEPQKDFGNMEEPPDLLAATMRMDLDEIKKILKKNPNSIGDLNGEGNNAMHLCIGGGSHRVKHIMQFFVDHTAINLLHENADGYSPIDLANAINDKEAVDFLYEPTVRQLRAAYPDDKAELVFV